jgi:SAM-dependent methyltransferase
MARKKPQTQGEPVRHGYQEHGVDGFYDRFGADYRNPHEKYVNEVLAEAKEKWALDLRECLDLACGSGEVTLALRALGAGGVTGVDPYTGAAFRARTGLDVLPLRFEDVGAGALAGRRFSVAVCSFALHLLDTSRLPQVVFQLSQVTDTLVVVTPHKRPQLEPRWGFSLVDEVMAGRVRARLYRAAASG